MPRMLLLPLALLPLALLLGACRFTSFPLIPPVQTGNFPARLAAGTLARAGENLELRLTLDARTGAGFLEVAWFDGDVSLGRDRAYVDAAERAAVFRLAKPPGGEFRALVSFEGVVLRQFELAEPVPAS